MIYTLKVGTRFVTQNGKHLVDEFPAAGEWHTYKDARTAALVAHAKFQAEVEMYENYGLALEQLTQTIGVHAL